MSEQGPRHLCQLGLEQETEVPLREQAGPGCRQWDDHSSMSGPLRTASKLSEDPTRARSSRCHPIAKVRRNKDVTFVHTVASAPWETEKVLGPPAGSALFALDRRD